MKFLCDNCKAKYQIPDEKIRGRTLKMKCRKCEHPILIRGPQEASSPKAPAPKPAAPRRASSSVKPAPKRRGGSSVGPRPVSRPAPAAASALGAEFRRGGSLAPEPAPQKTAVEWYSAINDVPVGPIKRDELARKIGTGAVHAKSLCWREGMDDWKPLEQVPELASLLASRRVPAPPPRPAAGARAALPPKKESSRSNVVPIGGRMGAGATPGFDEDDEKTVMAPPPAAASADSDLAPLPIGEPESAAAPAAFSAPPTAPTAPGLSAPPAAQPKSRGLPPPLLIALVGAGAFGVALAFIAGKKMFADPPTEVASNQSVEEEGPLGPELEIPDEELEGSEEGEAEEGETEEGEGEGTEEIDDSPSGTTMRRAPTTAMAPSSAMGESSEMLTAAQQALLDRYGSDSSGGPSLMSVDVGSGGSSSRAQLDASAVRRVVSAASNRRALQRCYETAIRGASDAPSVRMDIEVRVGASGTVTRVSASGNDFNGLKACLERTVRRWRFPPSSAGGETRFPVVFSPSG